MANNMMTLLTSAAEMRSGGVSWEMIGALLNRSANTCRQWPNRYPEEWKNLYAQAEEERWQEAGHEAVATLRRLLHDENPRIQIQSASHLIKWSMFHKKLEVQQGIDPNRTYYDVNHFVAEEDDSPYVPLTERIPKQYDTRVVPEATTASLVGTAAACFLLLLCFSWQAFAGPSTGLTPNHSVVCISDSGWHTQDGNPKEPSEDYLVQRSADLGRSPLGNLDTSDRTSKSAERTQEHSTRSVERDFADFSFPGSQSLTRGYASSAHKGLKNAGATLRQTGKVFSPLWALEV